MTLAAIPTPSVDWYALAPLLILLGATALCLLAAVLLPETSKRAFSAVVTGAAFAAASSRAQRCVTGSARSPA